ncbi:MAG: DNA primase [Anaerolineae bacterium]
MSVADEIRQRLDLVDVVSEYVTLKKAGRSLKGLCPFHQEKTPSFIVFPETQTWHCFGACGEGGDVFSFIQKREGVDFGEALRILAQRAGVSLHASPEAAEEAEVRDRLHEVLAAAAAYFGEQLASPAGEAARAYLQKRGVGEAVTAEFGLGYAPPGWRSVSTRLMTNGYSRDELAQAGLIAERDDGGFYDRFRHRLMFPIWDRRGRVVAFGARSLDGSEPKYLNSPQTRLFDKGSLLYGLHKARQAIMADETVVIVEGYMDVIAAHEAGYRNVVAGMGTALSEAQLQSVSRSAHRYVLALDADAAGSAATLRGVAVAGEALEGEAAPTLEGGLLHFEKRLNAEIRIAVLPEGLDPDDLIRRDAPAWQKLIAEAKPLVDYLFDVALAEEDLSTAKGKSRIAARLIPVVAQVPDAFERAHHVERLARHLGVDAALVEGEVAAARGGSERRLPRRSVSPARPQSDEGLSLEEYALGYLFRDADALSALSRALVDCGIDPLSDQDFRDPAHRSLVALLQTQKPTDRIAFRSALDAPSRRAFDHLDTVWARQPELDDNALRQDVLRAILNLRRERLLRYSGSLRMAMEGSEDQEEARQFGQAVDAVTDQLRLVMATLARTTMLRSRERIV